MESKPEYRLVRYAFRQAGLHTTDILQCKKLSKAVLQKTGQHISAVTIFRLARPEKYNIRPYPNTLQILLDYCDISTLEDVPELVAPKKVLSFISYNPEDDSFALDALLTSLLQSENLKILHNFLERMPERYNAIPYQQRTISHSFANYFRAQRHSIKAVNMFKELNKQPNFQIYFTMSFPDMDFVNGYFYEGLALYIKNFDVEKSLSVRHNPYTQMLSSPLEKNIYHYTLYIWMSYVKNNLAGVKQMGQLLYGKDHLPPQSVEALAEVTVTYTRYLTAGILYYHVAGIPDKRQEGVQKLVEYLQKSLSRGVGQHRLVFMTAMACDALLLTGQSMDCLADFLKMEDLRKYAFMEYEPACTRFLHYGRRYDESLLSESANESPYQFGFYEQQFSLGLQSLFNKKHPELIRPGQ